jgi:hypothetical protein
LQSESEPVVLSIVGDVIGNQQGQLQTFSTVAVGVEPVEFPSHPRTAAFGGRIQRPSSTKVEFQ